MGRRSQHTPEELRELILSATFRIVEANGFHALSAREIAREIGYAPGTLYNMFQNLDEILMRVEARVLADLERKLSEAMQARKDIDALRCFASQYVQFAYRSPRLWELIQRHHPEDCKAAPDWYLEQLYAPIARLGPVIGRVHELADPDDAVRAARLVWSAVHGMVSVATTSKFGALPEATTLAMVEGLITQLLLDSSAAKVIRKEHPRYKNGDARRDRHSD